MTVFINGNGDTRSGFCGYRTDDPFECAGNLNVPCPQDQVTILKESVTGTIDIKTTVTVHATLTFTSSYDNNYGGFVVENIQLVDVQGTQFSNTVVSWQVLPPTLTNWVINLLGGVGGIKQKVNAFVTKELNQLLPQIIQAVNQTLDNVVITLG